MGSRLAFSLAAALLLPAAGRAATTVLVSADAGGAPAGGHSNVPGGHDLSADGRFVSFFSTAAGFVAGECSAGRTNVLLRDLQAGTTECVSSPAAGDGFDGGGKAGSVSGDGRFVSFARYSPPGSDQTTAIFLKDRLSGAIEPLSVNRGGELSNGSTGGGRGEPMSRDGRFALFSSAATNLAPGGDATWRQQLYLRDRRRGVTERVSVATAGAAANASSVVGGVSDTGRYVVFTSYAENLVPGDGNGTTNIFLRDRWRRTTVMVDRAPSGAAGDSAGEKASISGNGRFVAFMSCAGNLVPADTPHCDVFVADRLRRRIEKVSVNGSGQPANWGSWNAAISRDGRHVAFTSRAWNMGFVDQNGMNDLFVRDRLRGTTELVSADTAGAPADGPSDNPSISDDGRVVVFHSPATDLVPGVGPGHNQVYARIRDTGPDADGDGHPALSDCDDADASVHPAAAEIPLDGVDQDCNGADLTIAVLRSEWDEGTQVLTVTATSAHGARAELGIDQYATAMTWLAPRGLWKATRPGTPRNPGTITVSGLEGSRTVPVTTVRR